MGMEKNSNTKLTRAEVYGLKLNAELDEVGKAFDVIEKFQKKGKVQTQAYISGRLGQLQIGAQDKSSQIEKK